MNNTNAHKLGYKHTPLGWIPDEWEVLELGKNMMTFSGGTPNRSVKDYYGGLIPWIKSGELNQGTITFIQETITEEGLNNSSAKIVESGTLLLALYGATAGISAFTSIRAAINQAILAIVPDSKIYDKVFLNNWFKSSKDAIIYSFCQGAQPNLSAELVSHFLIKTPPIGEQLQIVRVLSIWDEAIQKTRQLIEQLKQRNKGLSQQLLSGKKSLKGFSGKWQHLQVREIASEVSLKNRADKTLTVLSCTKYHGLVDSLEYFGRKIYSEDTSTYKVVPERHFAYATNHIEEGSIGYQTLYKEALISPMYTVFKTTEQVNDNYLYKVLKSQPYIHEYQKRMEGSIDRRGGLRWDEFSKIPLYLPPYEEQTAVAGVLDKANSELKLYEQQLAFLQQQKKGLMQKLLSGEVRVKAIN